MEVLDFYSDVDIEDYLRQFGVKKMQQTISNIYKLVRITGQNLICLYARGQKDHYRGQWVRVHHIGNKQET